MNELPPGSVTTADLYRELIGLRGDLGRALLRLERLDTVNSTAEEIHRDHEQRLRSLETFRWKLAGACLLVSGAAGVLAAFVHH
jgi:hypothetical protein